MAQSGIKTVAELARRMKLNRQTVHRWVAGEGDPTPELLFKLSDVLQCNARWLALGHPESPVKPMTPTPEQAEVLDIFTRLPPAAQETWMTNGRDLLRLLTPASVNNPFAPIRK